MFSLPLTTKKAIFLLIIVGCLIFFNALFGGFIWDDFSFIINNLDTRTLNLTYLFGVNTFNSSGYYRPIPALYFSLLFHLFHYHPFFYHFLQVMLHITNSCLVFLLFKKFFSKSLSFFLALIFLIHPIQVESVAYIGASQSELFFFFGCAGLLISMQTKLGLKHYLFTGLFLLLSLLTKETGILFLLMTILFQWCFNRKKVFSFLPFLLSVLILYCFIRFGFAGVYFEKINFVPIGRLPLMERLITMPSIIFYYLQTLFYPARLAVEQHWVVTAIDWWHFFFPLFFDLCFFLIIGFSGFSLFKTNKQYFAIFSFFLTWFLGGFLMLLQIFPLDMTVADRWFYFPLVGLLGILGIIFQKINLQKKPLSILITITILLLLMLAIRTIIRNANWHTELSLYSHDVALEDNFDNEYNYAAAFSHVGNYTEALPHIRKSVALFPYETNLRGLGLVYSHLGKKQLAIYYYQKAFEAKSYVPFSYHHEPDTYYYLSKFNYLAGDAKTAKKMATLGLTDYPQNSDLLILLAISDYKLYDKPAALQTAQKVYKLNPNSQTLYILKQIVNNAPLTITTN